MLDGGWRGLGQRDEALHSLWATPYAEKPTPQRGHRKELSSREAKGHTDLRKNKPQLNATQDRVLAQEPGTGPRFRKPDVSSVRPDGVRHNINYVSNLRDLKREIAAFEDLVHADGKAIHELYLLDGTLVRRYVPPGVSFP
jgi:hypothetical protein